MKKLIKGVLLTIAILFITGMLFIGALWYSIVYDISDIDESVSPNNSYKVEFQAIGQSVGFGSQHARLVLFSDKNKISITEFWIANDGKVVSERDWKAEWFDNRVEVLVFGEEQNDELYIMFFDGTTEIEYPRTHYGKEIPSVRDDVSISEENNKEEPDVDTHEIKSDDDSYIYQIEDGIEIVG